MREITLPSGIVQPQAEWERPTLLDHHFRTLNYVLPPQKSRPPRRDSDATFKDTGQLWHAILKEKRRAYMPVVLEDCYLSEWFPRSPGLYHIPQARMARELAVAFIDRRFGAAPIDDRIREPAEARRRARRKEDHTLVLTPEGKMSMLKGGVGCIRLKPVEQEGRIFWLMSASSSGVAHEGFPLAVPKELYNRVSGPAP